MRVYEVQLGDSPASIAAEHAGCPKCAIDLIGVNGHKSIVSHPNGFVSFADLRAGEKLNLPDKWWSKDFEDRPPAYFAALPYADGVTPSSLGDAAAGVLGDFAALDAATTAVSILNTLDDESFTHAADNAATLIYSAVGEAIGNSAAASAAYARDVQTATEVAKQHLRNMRDALDTGNQSGASDARFDAGTALTNALGSARLALQSYYAGSQPAATPASTTPASSGPPMAVLAAGQLVLETLAADVNYCTSVAQSGSAVNAAVHAFKEAWNASGQSPVPINTGNYEQSVADALTSILGNAPPGCSAHAAPPPPPVPQPLPTPVPVARVEEKKLSTGAMLGIGLIGAGAVGGAIYLATRKPRRGRLRRTRR